MIQCLEPNISLMYIRQNVGKNFAYNEHFLYFDISGLILPMKYHSMKYQFQNVNCVNLSFIH